MSLDDRPDSRPDHPAGSDTLTDAPPITDPAPVVAAVDPTPARRSRLRLPLLLAAPVLAIVIGLFVYLSGGRYQSTDNGYVKAGLVPVAASVSGPVVAVMVHDNQRVRAGDILFRIDPAPFQAAVDEAAADLANARTQVSLLRANYREGEAGLAAARARLDYAEREAARQKSLLAEGISSQNQYDQAVLAAQTARQQILTSVQQNAGVAATLTGSVDAPTAVQPAVQRAEAALERARLNLGYTVVRAAQDGIVTKVDQLQRGSYVTAAKPVFTLAGTRLWIEGNFKEDQLNHMRVGQRATFHVDAFPDLELTGRLTSFSPGTGNSFALLPAENATGNWVKVVQRLPVEFSIDRLPQNVPLHAGLSVEVTVDTGYRRRLFGGDAAAR
ncbi:secretion protein HlyD [Sphingomonas melonis TY]|mgnify:CR=1 FL=1|jgi:membrane fusion protein, multidrug efflux system|uniref:Secretion protein HlyD n=1 Tax=Sphingomonas melonis TY TaxID=621456 RepID=A0A154NB33_9SPHN|nr:MULTISPECIES: HlyD family secretion protein [Sphingomonas]AOW23800.1 secretion protein HlyD [Sphingomonas melonis TY]ATI54805.1 HlyD family secretion protein [Sphingomonas melonis]KZB96811.1 secretion protein HlyD [Sphingomonas melonis TY]MBX8846135.1 HlyD family secretion protein [Sphingomonas melonis]MBX8855286.1 HlyD family secretion protein [Sphingomonas melonis]